MLTKKQTEFLEALNSFIESKGYVPTVREMCKVLNLSSPSTAHSYLKKLESEGYITRDKNKSRRIITKGEKGFLKVPVIGTVTAGIPIFAYENIEGYIPVSEELARGRELFILNVIGDSMIEKGILDGDKLIVQKSDSAKNGDTVVALIDDSATVKTLVKEENRVYLMPANSMYKPIYSENIKILGIAIGLMREF